MTENKRDYCGPAGDSPIAKAISKAIPDQLLGVDLSDCCRHHDQDIVQNGPNKKGDWAFKSCIKCTILEAVKYPWLASMIARVYYWGGRIGAARYRL